jgi:hypothetical protein
MSHPLIFLWSPPRSLSTAFLRMMLERGDFLVVHEPFSSVVVQGYTTIDDRKFSGFKELGQFLRECARTVPVFVKETTEYRYDLSDDPLFFRSGIHSFIVRDPRSAIASHYAMNNNVTCAEIGYEHQYEVFRAVVAARRAGPPTVIEAEALLADATRAVRRYCRQVGIPFRPDALHWAPGDMPEWARTKEWHRDVANSTGFQSKVNTYAVTVDNNETLAAYYRHHLKYYERMRRYPAGWAASEPEPEPEGATG